MCVFSYVYVYVVVGSVAIFIYALFVYDFYLFIVLLQIRVVVAAVVVFFVVIIIVVIYILWPYQTKHKSLVTNEVTLDKLHILTLILCLFFPEFPFYLLFYTFCYIVSLKLFCPLVFFYSLHMYF